MSPNARDAAPAANPERPQIAVIAVTRRGERLLLVQRRNPPDAGKWGFPGGRVERGETLIEAAQRELLEETGVHARPVGVLTALDSLHRDGGGALQFHFVLVAILLDWRAGEGVPADDAQATGWLTLAELERGGLALSKDVVAVARQALATAIPGG
ncbi:MAG: NUDIX hydrolase [Pseudomonadota bacterium]